LLRCAIALLHILISGILKSNDEDHIQQSTVMMTNDNEYFPSKSDEDSDDVVADDEIADDEISLVFISGVIALVLHQI
jgi:hypothetical protein